MQARIIRIIILLFFSHLLSSQEIIWGGPDDINGSFNNGLNDWTAISVSPNDNALWFWNEDGIADDGAYAQSGSENMIQSETASNGAASFDSDFLDNDGIQGNFGNGLAPAPQRAELLSPQFSTLGYQNVYITWTQYMRQFDSEFSIEITSNGGETWVAIPIKENNAIPKHKATEQNMKVALNVFDEMGNKDSVQFKFIYEADYYFWTIDDVAVIDGPPHDLEITDGYYPFEAALLEYDKFLSPDTLQLAVDITNNGNLYGSNSIVEVTFNNTDDEVLFSYSKEIGPIEKGDTVYVEFDNVDLTFNTLFDIYHWDGQLTYDFNVLDTFNIGGIETKKVYEYQNVIDRYNLSSEVVGFKSLHSGAFAAAISVRRDPQNILGQALISKIEIIPSALHADSIYDTSFKAYIFSLLNQESPKSIEPLLTSTAFGADGNHENLKLIGIGETNITASENGEKVEIIMEPFNNCINQLLEGTYIIAIDWETENEEEIQLAISDRKKYNEHRSFAYIKSDSLNIGWKTLKKNISWNIDLFHGWYVANDDTQLEIEKLSIYPNPAFTTAMVKLTFTRPTDATVNLMNSIGNIIDVKHVEGVTEQNLTFDLLNLENGIYFIEVIAEDQSRSIGRFIKMK